jgi:hypothetical protein
MESHLKLIPACLKIGNVDNFRWFSFYNGINVRLVYLLNRVSDNLSFVLLKAR